MQESVGAYQHEHGLEIPTEPNRYWGHQLRQLLRKRNHYSGRPRGQPGLQGVPLRQIGIRTVVFFCKRPEVPRLMREARAANYVDLSLPTFKKFVEVGLFSPPRELNENTKVFDREQLDRDIDALPFAGVATDTSWAE
jgi:hypothetical protein